MNGDKTFWKKNNKKNTPLENILYLATIKIMKETKVREFYVEKEKGKLVIC